MAHLVDISIVALNQRRDLERLLPTLSEGFDNSVARILLLDNRSTDGTHEYIASRYPNVYYLFNNKVTGYGGNHNLNIKRSSAKYVLILNADIVVRFADLMRLVNHMQIDDSVVLATGRISGPDGAVQGLVKRPPTLAILVARLLGFPLRLPLVRRMNERYETRDLGYDKDRDVEIVSGAFMVADTAALRVVGGFDERYFMYFEDFDLCMRIRQYGRVRFFSDVQAIHLWHRDAHKSIRHMGWFLKSAARFFVTYGCKLV
jgi:GT2 family glycosyltransferase